MHRGHPISPQLTVKPLGPAVARTLEAVRTLASTPIATKINGTTNKRSPRSPLDPLPMSTTGSAPAHVVATIAQLVVRPVYTACWLGPALGSEVMAAPSAPAVTVALKNAFAVIGGWQIDAEGW